MGPKLRRYVNPLPPHSVERLVYQNPSTTGDYSVSHLDSPSTMNPLKRAKQPLERAEDGIKRVKHGIGKLFHSEGGQIDPPTEPASPMEEDIPDVAESSMSVMNIGPQATTADATMSMNRTVPDSQSAAHPGVNLVPDPAEEDEATSRGSPIPRIPQVTPGATSNKGKGLKGLVKSGILRPVTNLIGPVKEIAGLIGECVDTHQMVGEAKTEYDQLQSRLEDLLDDLKQYFREDCSPIMTSSMQCLCE
ncbi:hypothetical protein FRC11_007213 [Ceratobasidium sp. 423]|nr:hypothetical protein FRC11_007213 [Ceratobasidium sp. 423]